MHVLQTITQLLYRKFNSNFMLVICRFRSPHVRVIDLCFDFDPRSNFDRLMLRAVDYRRLLQHITFELFAGDVLALLYTSGRF